ncbi:MAG: hypothetical protein R3E94_02850 [Burkholderiaceae bacterium]
MSAKTYTSAVDRLKELPEVFTGTDLNMVFGWTSGISSTYLANWRRAGLVRSLGGRSDVHMNRVVNPKVNPETALRRAYPQSVKVGVDILREAGWTTQIPTRPEVAVPQSGPVYSVEDFDLVARSDAWFERVRPGMENAPAAIARLRPAWALADMIARAQDRRVRSPWLLDPQDIDLEAAAADKDMEKALAAFGLDPQCFSPDGYADLYDGLQMRPHPRDEITGSSS